MSRKNSALMQGYMHQMNTESVSITDNEAELRVDLNNEQDDMKITCQIKLENEPIIEETEDVFVNVEDFFVKEEPSLKREEIDDEEESSLVNIVSEICDNHMDSEIIVYSNTHGTDNIVIKHCDIVISEYTIGEQNIPYQCNVCSISFHTKQQLNSHTISTEHVTQRFCKYCKQSLDIGEFDVHMKQHENEEIFCCEYCGEMIYELNTFTRHSRIHRQHKYQLCPMQFDAKFLLKQHLIVHTGINRDVCKHCNHKFKRASALIRHLAARTCLKNKDKFGCTVCEQRFDTKKQCMQHVAQHKFLCTICNKILSSEKFSKNHLQLVHGITA